jgi:hypothetical protein
MRLSCLSSTLFFQDVFRDEFVSASNLGQFLLYITRCDSPFCILVVEPRYLCTGWRRTAIRQYIQGVLWRLNENLHFQSSLFCVCVEKWQEKHIPASLDCTISARLPSWLRCKVPTRPLPAGLILETARA